ncbi:hypothetical protein Tco_0433658, partial [Tanacetum coccineum]
NSIHKDTLPLTHIQPTSEPTTPTNVHVEENNDNQAEFTNPFCKLVHDNAETTSHNIGNSNVHTFNQPQDSEYRWTKDHPLTQVRGNPTKPVQARPTEKHLKEVKRIFRYLRGTIHMGLLLGNTSQKVKVLPRKSQSTAK